MIHAPRESGEGIALRGVTDPQPSFIGTASETAGARYMEEDYSNVLPERIRHARRIVKDPRICGGEARIVNTRIPVWLLESLRRQGASDQHILDAYPTLGVEDLKGAWDYVRRCVDEIEDDIRANEDD